MIRVGDIEIEFINDGRALLDAGGVFGLVPRVLWSRFMQADEQNRIPMDHRCLLARAGGKTIVVETGHGTKLTEKQIRNLALTRPEGDLVEGLARLGVSPEQVDLVVLTHLHADHCGGNTRLEGDRLVPTFPNAEYWVQRLEYADAAFPNERTRGTYFLGNYDPLYVTGQMRLLDGETDIVPGMRCVVTPGHTRGHQSIVFEQGGQAAIFLGDLAVLGVHFAKLAWTAAFDVEPLVTLETKRAWQRWALAREALLLFGHDPHVEVGKLVEDEGRPAVVPV
ncbi:MAG: MBL fold metallo-hydrolase [Anaerolineae bacterium]|nr:MBL fold metallo-hydrolase [Anaerolineae bacterium]